MNLEERLVLVYDLFNKGNSCAQTMILGFSDLIAIDREQLFLLSSGLGGGMARTNHACGILSGSVIVLGYRLNQPIYDKTKTYSLISGFVSELKNEWSNLNCFDLLGCDLNTEEGKIRFSEKNLKNNICTKVMESAVRRIHRILELP